MAAIEALIMIGCMGMSGVSNEACRKALEAGAKQSGVEHDINMIEDRISKRADRDAREIIGEDGMQAGAFMVGTGRAVVEKIATLRFPAFAPSMFVNIQISSQKMLAGIEWNF